MKHGFKAAVIAPGKWVIWRDDENPGLGKDIGYVIRTSLGEQPTIDGWPMALLDMAQKNSRAVFRFIAERRRGHEPPAIEILMDLLPDHREALEKVAVEMAREEMLRASGNKG